MKKKILSVLLSASMVLTMSGMTALAGSIGDPGGEMLTEKAAEADVLRLWYDEPVSGGTTILQPGSFGTNTEDNQWQQLSLPIGNSYMGANVYGEIGQERLTFNQKTLWNGGPSESRPNYNGGNKTTTAGGKLMTEAYKDVVDAFLKGDSSASSLCNNLVGESSGYGAYQSWGDIFLTFEGLSSSAQTKDYERSLNLEEGVASVDFTADGTAYHREYFISYPDKVLAMKLTAEGGKKLNFNVSFPVDNEEGVTGKKLGKEVTYTVDAAAGTIVTAGKMQDNQMKMNSMLQVITAGSVAANENGNSLDITGADEAIIFVAADTDYENTYPSYRTGETDAELAESVAQVAAAAKAKGYDKVKEDHLADYTGLFGRLNLDLGQEASDKTTDELLAAYKAGSATEAERRLLEVLLYQYGRYLTIASSREGDLPSNLQGVWQNRVGDANRVPWGSDYHMNVNLQMNYWPTYSANLAECAVPLIDYVDSLREPGRVTAAAYYGITSKDGEENGFTAHTQNTPFGWTCPGWDFSWGWSPAAVPWILQNCWEYYEYTGDVDYMKEHIYPMLREEAVLYDKLLVDSGVEITREDGTKSTRLVSAPTYSPEHGPRTLGNAYEQELIWQLYEDVITAAETLGVDADKVAEWKETQSRLAPVEVGDSGQIKEWYTETTLGSIGERGHRHMSHLLGLFPGDLISVDNDAYMDAAIVSLTDRGMTSTGWGMGQRINSWARTGQGNTAYQLIKNLFQGGIYPNLWDAHAPFQIDGNFGYTSGVNEMLMQSNMGYINLLPALPDDWSEGHIDGLVARGNFELDMNWSKGLLDDVTILSKNGGEAVVQYKDIFLATVTDENGKEIEFKKISDDRISFATEKGRSYQIREIPVREKVNAPSGLKVMRTVADQVMLTWSAAGTEGAKYNVYRQIDDGEWVRIAENVEGTQYADQSAYEVMGKLSYKVSAVVKGIASECCAAAKETDYRNMAGMIDDQDSRVIYTGSWGNWSENTNYAGTIKYLENPVGTETAELTFLGTGIEVVSCKNHDRGFLAVTIDGEDCGEVDTYSSETQKQMTVFSKADLEYGLHTIVLRATGSKNTSSSKAKVELDAFKVLDKTAVTVSSVSVDTKSGMHTVGKANSKLQMTADVLPENTANRKVTWSVTTKSGEAAGTIDEHGLLTLNDKNGVVTVTATSLSDSSKTGSLDITIALAGTSEQTTIIEDSVDKANPNPAITWNPAWSTWAGEADRHHGGTKTECSEVGAYFEYTFTGTGIEVYVQKHANFGNLEISVKKGDTVVAQETCSMEGSSSGDDQQCLYSKKNLTDDTYTIRCTVAARDGKTAANLDYLKVFAPAASTADKSALQTVIEKYEDKKQSQYEENTWKDFQSAMDAAVTAMNNSNSDASNFDALISALESAADELKEKELPAPVIPEQAEGKSIAESGRIMLLWDAVEGAESYHIYVNGEKKAATENPFVWISELIPGTEYTFSIKAVNAAGQESARAIEMKAATLASATDTVLDKVTGLQAVKAETDDQVKLTWTASEGAVKYEIWIAGKMAGMTEETTYMLSGLTKGQIYTAKVVAVNGQDRKSEAASVTFTAGKLSDPAEPDKPDQPDQPDQPANPGKPDPKPTPTPPTPDVKNGDTFSEGSFTYKVISTTAMTAEVVKLKNGKLTKLRIGNEARLGGKTYRVTGIAASAFKGNKKITSVSVGKNVETIGNNAFAGCTKLKKVTIGGNGLKKIGAKAFSGCKKLKSITIKGKKLKTVGKNAFKNIHAKAVIKVPKAKYKAYKKLLAKKGQKKTVKIKK